MSGNAGSGEEGIERIEQVFDFVGRGLRFTRIGLIGHFGRAHQHLLVPRDQENRACVHRLGENGGIRCARKTWQYDEGAANSTDHRTMRVDSGTLANSVGPRAGSVDDPRSLDPLLSTGRQIAE